MASLEELLPEQIDVEGFVDLADAEECAFYLYRETTILVGIAAHICQTREESPLDRDQAILAALLIRIFKFMKQTLRLASDRSDAEIIQVFTRCILESVISLELLASANGKKYFDEYVEKSLAPERELFDEIQANIQSRNGEILPIETRMLTSIDNVTKASGKKFAISILDKDSGLVTSETGFDSWAKRTFIFIIRSLVRTQFTEHGLIFSLAILRNLNYSRSL